MSMAISERPAPPPASLARLRAVVARLALALLAAAGFSIVILNCLTGPEQPPPSAAATDPAAELALLQLAQSILDYDPRGAFALTEEHERRFERGMFEEQRELLAIDALRRLGRDAEADKRARVKSLWGERHRDATRGW